MRLSLICMRCTEQERAPSKLYPAELRDDGMYELSCDRGHRSVTCLQEMRFEVLYDVAANAINDGYYRDAVVTFASALERFFEFAVAVICHARGVRPEEFEQAWKAVRRQSERQLGAYVFAHLLQFGQAAKVLNESAEVKFRNDVVHNGKIPTRQEAMDFGKVVIGLVYPVLTRLKKDLGDAVGNVIGQHVRKVQQLADKDHQIQVMTIPTALSVTRDLGAGGESLEQTMERLRRPRRA